MGDRRDTVAAWVAHEILPHEKAVYAWVSRRWGHIVDPEDVIQEAYCRVSGLASVDHIANPIGYFRRTVYAAVVEALRRGGVFISTAMTENEYWGVIDDDPLADRVLEAEQELQRVASLLSGLSETCRRAIELRRIEQVSQREAAEQLGVSEDVIRNHLVRGVKKILQAMAAQDAAVGEAWERESARLT